MFSIAVLTKRCREVIVVEDNAQDAGGKDEEGEDREEDVIRDGCGHLRAVVFAELLDGTARDHPELSA